MHAKPNQPTQAGAAELCCVVALDCESRPLVEAMGLARRNDCRTWPVFCSADERHWLVVSGVGRAASAAATGFLAALAGQPRGASWLNVGIAGHASLPLGELRRAAKVTDSTSGRSWYPPEVTRASLAADVLTTVDRPSRDYPGGGLVDMEAAGFYPAASRLASREKVQVVKVVSDNAEQSFDKTVNARQVRSWIEDASDAIVSYAAALCQLEAGARNRDRDREALKGALLEGQAFHLSATQLLQFDRLVERLEVLGGIDQQDIERLWKGAASSREALHRLEAEASRRPLNFARD